MLDVLGGRAVHAIGGDRARYRPLRSILHADPAPRELARSFREALGLNAVYLADLDAITVRRGDLALYREVAGLEMDLWLDAGLHDERDLDGLLPIERLHVVAGLESLHGPDALARTLAVAGPERLIVSLDLRDGRPITPTADAWPESDAIALGRRILGIGVRRLILLDLSRVGRGSGTGTAGLLDALLATHPDSEIAVGGGISTIEDVERCRDCGASAVLVGSALHDGRIGRSGLERLGLVSEG